MLKILFVIQNFSDLAGSQRVVAELSNALCANFQMDIAYRGNECPAYSVNKKVRLLSIDCSQFLFPFKVKSLIQSNDYEFILIHTMNKLTVSLLLAGVRHKKLYSLEHISHSNNSFLIKALKKLFYCNLTGIVCLTNRDTNYYLNIHPNVRTIPNFSPYSIKPTTTSGEPIVLAIGTLDNRKGFDRLLHVWKKVEQEDSQYVLHIYGEGPEKEKLQSLIKRLGLNRVFLKGRTTNPERAYSTASFFVMSSRYEGLPMVLIEAQTHGLPIIAFDCPFGPKEVITDGVDGFLIPDDNIRFFAEKLLMLMKDKSKRERFSKTALQNAQRFNKDKIVEQWSNLIMQTSDLTKHN